MRYSAKFIEMATLGLSLACAGVNATDITASHDSPGGSLIAISAAAAAAQATTTANYAFVPLNVPGAPLRVTEDGTAILLTAPKTGNVYAYRWRQGAVTELSVARPAGTRIKLHAANRNGMVVVVFESSNGAFFTFEGGSTKQVIAAWMPNSTAPVLLNVPVSRATTWFDQRVMRSVEFKFLDDQNRIWGITNHESATPEGNLVHFELARWDTPDAAPTFIGHKQRSEPSVHLLGVSSGSGEPFGYYSPPEFGSGTYPFAGSLSNRLNYVPAQMNSQGWVLGKRGFTPVLSRDGVEYPVPANPNIALIDDRNNLYDNIRFTVWTTNPETMLSTPTIQQNSYVALPMRAIALPDGYSTNQRVAPGDATLELSTLFTPTTSVPAIFVPAEIRPDANRDGAITVSRMPDDPDRLLAEQKLPWYFWVNDDNDSGETDGNDIPGQGSNGQDASVNGVRDLVDFFPLHLNIARLLSVLPADIPGISYRLAQADGAANFLTTEFAPASVGNYQFDAITAQGVGSKTVTRITTEGVALDPTFLGSASRDDRGVILVEARGPTTKPLRLEAWRGTELLARLDLPVSFSGVEDMFRHVNLVGAVGMKAETPPRGSPPNWSGKLENTQAFVFVHGYNVNQQQARGWQAEFFKRLWWSGSRAQFWGVTWYGSESQVPVAHFTPNYQLNVVHAFGTAPVFKQFIEELRAKTGVTKVNVAGHSLGNMVVSSAISDYQAPIDRYFMIDAAVAAEAYDGAQEDGHVVQPDDGTAFLPHTEWNKERGGVYPQRLWATNWYKLFPTPTNNPATDDARAKLTWRDRFAPKDGVAYYDFHSTGEEVLGYDENHARNTPSLAGVLWSEFKAYFHITLPGQLNQPNGYQTWLYQEQLKGRTITGKVLGSNYGGWGFNVLHFNKNPGGAGGKGPVLTPAVLNPAEITPAVLATVFTDEVLREEPFFRPGGFFTKVGTWKYDDGAKRNTWSYEPLRQLYGPTTGSTFAAVHRDTLLARMIPAMSPAAGRIPVPAIGTPSADFNFDMSSSVIRGVGEPWPVPSVRRDRNWRHSDLRVMAYPYVRGLYKKLVEVGTLDAKSP